MPSSDKKKGPGVVWPSTPRLLPGTEYVSCASEVEADSCAKGVVSQ